MNAPVEDSLEPGADARDHASDPKVALLIAVTERSENVVGVYDECRAAFEDSPYDPAFVLAAEPWAADRLEPLRDRRAQGESMRLLVTGQTVGETVLLRSALAVTEADIVVTVPAYHRVDNSVLPALIDKVRAGVDMALARRWPRRDSALNRFQSRTFHSLLRTLTGSELSDIGCGVRAFRPNLLDDLPVYGDFGRFLPVLAARRGYRVEEIEAEQHPQDRSTRVYSPGVYVRRLLDLFGVYFLTRFTEKPLRFFGLFGATFLAGGLGLLVVLTIQRFQGQSLADRPLLLLGVVLVVLGVQAIALGLVGEIIVHVSASRRKPYRLDHLHGVSSD